MAAACGLNVAAHLTVLLEDAEPPPGCSHVLVDALEAALETATQSLGVCQQQQSQLLRRGVRQP